MSSPGPRRARAPNTPFQQETHLLISCKLAQSAPFNYNGFALKKLLPHAKHVLSAAEGPPREEILRQGGCAIRRSRLIAGTQFRLDAGQ